MLHWKLVRQRALAKQSHRAGGGNEVRILTKQIHAAALDERPRRYAPSGTAKQSHRRPKSPSTLPPFTRAILAKRNTPFYAREIRALQRGFRAGSFAADWHRQHIVMAGLVLIAAKIKGPRAFCSLAPHPKSGLPDFGTKHVEIGYSRFRLRGEFHTLRLAERPPHPPPPYPPPPAGEGRVGATSPRKRGEVKLRGNSLT